MWQSRDEPTVTQNDIAKVFLSSNISAMVNICWWKSSLENTNISVDKKRFVYSDTVKRVHELATYLFYTMFNATTSHCNKNNCSETFYGTFC